MCNGHSECKVDAKKCDQPCQHNTEGDNCEKCAQGYFGIPVNGGQCEGKFNVFKHLKKKRKTRQNTRTTSCNLTNFFSKLILKDFTDFYELFRYFCNEYQCNVILQGLHE